MAFRQGEGKLGALAAEQPGPSAPDSRFVSVRDVTKRFGSLEALGPTSLHVERGEFVSIVGPSGCGKSTLLEIVGGLQAPDQGAVSVQGAALRGPRDSTAMVFQEASTLPWRTVLDNVAFLLEVKGTPRTQRHQAARRLIETVGLSGFEGHYPAQLSGGMRQRVAIARSLSLNPDLMLADEPFGALDEQTRLMLAFELLRIVDQVGCGVLFVTHSIQEAVLLSDRVLVMSARPGRITEEVEITLPRPRSTESLGSPDVAHLIDRVWTVLKDEAITAMGAQIRD
jgi:NitT/TauT family transport system ATP-binding protein